MSEIFNQRAGTVSDSTFTPGFAARHDAAAAALVRAFPVEGAPVSFVAGRPAARRSAPMDGKPRHFSPADAAARPTAGWDPLDPSLQTPHIDPLEAAHAAGYAEGLAAAATAACGDEARDHGLLAELAETLAGAGRIDRERIARQLRDTVLMLTGRLVGQVGIAADLLAERVEAATDMLADAAESALLRIHPDDIALLEGRLPKTIFAAGDPAIARGSFVLESASTIIEDGPALWLEELAGAIERVPLPGAPASC